jgi:uncharacterized protein DUF2637
MSAGGRTTRTDTLTRLATGLTVAGLSGVAGAISFSHMSTLAAAHGQLGWKATAFPISVDGLELVASLFILAQHRAGRRPGLLPWMALVVGTAASLAANIAVGGHDAVGRALAGWPAVSLLVSIKLLFSMFDHDQRDRQTTGDGQRAADPPRTDEDRPSAPDTTVRTVQAGAGRSRTVPVRSVGGVAWRTDGSADARHAAPDVGRGADMARVGIGPVADLLPAARAAHAALTASGRALSRDALARRMRQDGYTVSNARLSLLLTALRAEPEIDESATAGPALNGVA